VATVCKKTATGGTTTATGSRATGGTTTATGGTTTAKLIAPAPRASGSASIAMGGMATHIIRTISSSSTCKYFYFDLLDFFMEVPVLAFNT
jgi:hypothetical protein